MNLQPTTVADSWNGFGLERQRSIRYERCGSMKIKKDICQVFVFYASFMPSVGQLSAAMGSANGICHSRQRRRYTNTLKNGIGKRLGYNMCLQTEAFFHVERCRFCQSL